MRTALVVLLALVVVAPAQAATTKVTWPEAREYRAGEQIKVTVKGDRTVRVAVLRVSSSGKVMRALTRKTLKRGTVTATLARAGTYEVRVARRERTVRAVNVAASPPVAEPPAASPPPNCPWATAATLEATLGADRVQRGQHLPFTIKNLSETCLSMGGTYALEYHQGDGAWKPVPWPIAFPAMLWTLERGATSPSSVHIPADAPLGTYRILGYSGLTEPTFEVIA
jgi:hypothetical protein